MGEAALPWDLLMKEGEHELPIRNYVIDPTRARDRALKYRKHLEGHIKMHQDGNQSAEQRAEGVVKDVERIMQAAATTSAGRRMDGRRVGVVAGDGRVTKGPTNKKRRAAARGPGATLFVRVWHVARVRLHVNGAHELRAADIGILHEGRADPYAKIRDKPCGGPDPDERGRPAHLRRHRLRRHPRGHGQRRARAARGVPGPLRAPPRGPHGRGREGARAQGADGPRRRGLLRAARRAARGRGEAEAELAHVLLRRVRPLRPRAARVLGLPHVRHAHALLGRRLRRPRRVQGPRAARPVRHPRPLLRRRVLLLLLPLQPPAAPARARPPPRPRPPLRARRAAHHGGLQPAGRGHAAPGRQHVGPLLRRRVPGQADRQDQEPREDARPRVVPDALARGRGWTSTGPARSTSASSSCS